VGAAIHRLRIRVVHERDSLQPHRHDADVALGKLAMMLRASVSLVTAALVIARAVNILK